jgi:SprT protein
MIDDRLSAQLPESARHYVAGLLGEHRVAVRLTRPRRTKLGDHRGPSRGLDHHRITVNDDLNPYAFLMTLLHEIAHMTTWEKLRLRVRRYPPHGREWKREFERILVPVVSRGILPADIEQAVAASMQNPAAATCSDRRLLMALSRYDRDEPGRRRLEELPAGSIFRVDNGQMFRLGPRLRSRYQCFELPSGREYRVHSLTRVATHSVK